MRFTQAQVRQLVGITEETFRTWRKSLKFLQGRHGHAPNFSSNDVLALAAVAWMVQTLGIKISHLEDVSGSLFTACERANVPEMDSSYLIITQYDVRVMSPRAFGEGPEEGMIVIPIRLIKRKINSLMQDDKFSVQPRLPFT
jgi:hypothetical protein